MLVVQSLPFLAAVAIAALEGSRFNDFAYLARALEAELVGRRRHRRIGQRQARSGENRVETAQ